MTIERINPDGLSEPQGFVHVSVATGAKTIYVSGQVSQDADGNLVGAGDLAAQTEQAIRNVATALAAAGASLDNVADTTMFVKDWDESKLEQIMAGAMKAAPDVGASVSSATLIGVSRLFSADYLIEIKVIAVVDA